MRRPTIGPHVQRVVTDTAWEGVGFPARQESADDLEMLFSWADRHGQFERFLPRLRARPKERDAAIGEVRAAWYLENLGFVITSWEPPVTSQPGEIEIMLPNAAPIFVEVKGPTWESELKPDEQRGERKLRPRFLTGDARWTDPRVEVRRAAEKTMGKIGSNRPSLLVVVDRMFRSPVDDLEPADLFAILSDHAFDGLGGILCIDANWLKDDGSGVDYCTVFGLNPRGAGKPWVIPSAAAAALDFKRVSEAEN